MDMEVLAVLVLLLVEDLVALELLIQYQGSALTQQLFQHSLEAAAVAQINLAQVPVDQVLAAQAVEVIQVAQMLRVTQVLAVVARAVEARTQQ